MLLARARVTQSTTDAGASSDNSHVIRVPHALRFADNCRARVDVRSPVISFAFPASLIVAWLTTCTFPIPIPLGAASLTAHPLW